jgi:hypothetical protein
VAVMFSDPDIVPNRTTPVAEKSVEKTITALVVPERLTPISEGSDTRFRIRDVEPVFPARSVAIMVRVFAHCERLVSDVDQVHDPSVASVPLTFTLAIPPVSVTSPERRGTHVTVALFTCEVILTVGDTVSSMGII